MSKCRQLPQIPLSWLAAIFIICMTVLRAFGIDSFITASLTGISAYLFGRHVEQARKK